jgi:hypothetical protein
MTEGMMVIINGDAVGDQELKSNKGIINKFFTEPCIGGDDYELVELTLDNGDIAVVGAHEINSMRDILEKELVADALQGDTTVLAELLKSVPDHIIYASLSDKGQEDFEPIPTDGTTVELDTDEYVEVKANNLSIIIKHNDVGVSVDYYNAESEDLFREDQCWWEDAE